MMYVARSLPSSIMQKKVGSIGVIITNNSNRNNPIQRNVTNLRVNYF